MAVKMAVKKIVKTAAKMDVVDALATVIMSVRDVIQHALHNVAIHALQNAKQLAG